MCSYVVAGGLIKTDEEGFACVDDTAGVIISVSVKLYLKFSFLITFCLLVFVVLQSVSNAFFIGVCCNAS